MEIFAHIYKTRYFTQISANVLEIHAIKLLEILLKKMMTQ